MTNLENLRNALSSVVAIIGHTGDLKGRVRLQKLAYLLQQRGFDPLAEVDFSYHHYGPYSDQLAGALEQVVASGLVREVEHGYGKDRKLYVYNLNREHPDNEHLELATAEIDEVRSIIDASKTAHWRTLELAATVVYLERNLGLPREAAFTRALRLKPDCEPYRRDAEGLLRKLGFD